MASVVLPGDTSDLFHKVAAKLDADPGDIKAVIRIYGLLKSGLGGLAGKDVLLVAPNNWKKHNMIQFVAFAIAESAANAAIISNLHEACILPRVEAHESIKIIGALQQAPSVEKVCAVVSLDNLEAAIEYSHGDCLFVSTKKQFESLGLEPEETVGPYAALKTKGGASASPQQVQPQVQQPPQVQPPQVQPPPQVQIPRKSAALKFKRGGRILLEDGSIVRMDDHIGLDLFYGRRLDIDALEGIQACNNMFDKSIKFRREEIEGGGGKGEREGGGGGERDRGGERSMCVFDTTGWRAAVI